MRKYEPIWQQLKEVGKVKITALTRHHKTITKGVIKEKANDLIYKEYLTDSNFTAKLSITALGNELTFILIKEKLYSVIREETK